METVSIKTKNQERFLRGILESSPYMCIYIDLNYTIINMTSSFAKLMKIDRTEMIGQHLLDFRGQIPLDYQIIRLCIEERCGYNNFPISDLRFDYTNDLYMDISTISDSDEVIGISIVVKDISVLSTKNDQMKWAERLSTIGQIAAGAAHEIRNPLTSVRGFLQLLGRSPQLSGSEKELGYIRLMLSEIDRINHLVNEFLLLSKQKETRMRKLHLQEVLGDILPVVTGEAMLKNVDVEQHIEELVPYVFADPDLIKQVILNLCKNAFDAMPSGGKLKIELIKDEEQTQVLIRVRDTGSGIPSFMIDRIFDPFFTTKDKGTGLGLAICQQIMHDHGGQIRVQSKGYGTMFQLILPFASGE